MHSWVFELWYPHGQGLRATMSWKSAGYLTLALAREIIISLDSIGWRKTSKTDFENSGSSSKNNTPLLAREISPGFAICPPPISETADAVWWGALKGGFVIRALSSKSPEIE